MNPENIPEPTSQEENVWTVDPAVLWRDGNWTKIIPRSNQSRPELINAIARLSIVASILFAFLTRSFTSIGIGVLGLFASSRMAGCLPSTRSATRQNQPATSLGSHVSRRRRSSQKSSHKSRSHSRNANEMNQETMPSAQMPLVAQAPRQPPANLAPMAWQDMFGPQGAQSLQGQDGGGAMGAYVSMANASQLEQPQFDYFAPACPGSVVPPLEGGDFGSNGSSEMVPLCDVQQFQKGHFPHPSPSNSTQGQGCLSPSGTGLSGGPFVNSSPFQAGFPTIYGSAPTAVAPQPGQQTRPAFAHVANQAWHANAASSPMGPTSGDGPFQTLPSSGTAGWGAFANDGGYTSTRTLGVDGSVTPFPTSGQNFPTNYYQPHNLAPAGPALQTSAACFPPNKENPLGNPEIMENRVARPRLCPVEDPRSSSTQFMDQLYESPAQIASGYQFFPFPVQDVVEARDNYQDFVIKSGLTHFKDKYSIPSPGPYNIVDQIGPLGF